MKTRYSSLVVQPSRSSVLAWMLLCLIVALLITILIIEPALAQKKLTAAEAKDHVSEMATARPLTALLNESKCFAVTLP